MSVIAGDAFLGVLFKISLVEHTYTLLNGGSTHHQYASHDRLTPRICQITKSQAFETK